MKSFSSGDIAKICDVNPRTVIRWIEANKLRAFKLPGRGNNRVTHADLLSFLMENNIPIPQEIKVEQESACFIISKDKHLVRHAVRIARNAGYLTTVLSCGIEAGIEIAGEKPSLIMIDNQTSRCAADTLISTIDTKLSYRPHVIVFDETTQSNVSSEHNAQVFRMAKPADNYALAMVLDSIVEADQTRVA